MHHDFLDYDPRKLAPTCLYLACKAEECQVQAKLLLQYVAAIAGQPYRHGSGSLAVTEVLTGGYAADCHSGIPVITISQLLDCELALMVLRGSCHPANAISSCSSAGITISG